MSESPSIDDDRIYSAASRMYCINYLAFVIGLEIFKRETRFTRPTGCACNILSQSCGSVDFGLTLTKKVEVWTVK
jgi:hypothetical protein